MAQSRFERTIILLVLAILGSGWIFLSKEEVTERTDVVMAEAPMVGHLAPDFTLQTPQGAQVTLSDLVDRSGQAGRPVVLNFWASWCGPCRVETPELQNASLEYKNRIHIVGINQGESADTVTSFGASFGLTYPLLVDRDNSVNSSYDVSSLPTTVFIDRTGVVREVFIGILSKAVLEERMEALLD